MVGGRDGSLGESFGGGNRLPAPRPLYQRIVWPAANHTIDFDVQSHQGYTLCGWNKARVNYLSISELSPAGMEKFEDQLRDGTE